MPPLRNKSYIEEAWTVNGTNLNRSLNMGHLLLRYFPINEQKSKRRPYRERSDVDLVEVGPLDAVRKVAVAVQVDHMFTALLQRNVAVWEVVREHQI